MSEPTRKDKWLELGKKAQRAQESRGLSFLEEHARHEMVSKAMEKLERDRTQREFNQRSAVLGTRDALVELNEQMLELRRENRTMLRMTGAILAVGVIGILVTVVLYVVG